MAQRNPWLTLARALLKPLLSPKKPESSPRRGAATPRPRGVGPSPRSAGTAATGDRGGTYAGDYTGRLRPVYSPRPDGRPDPGEIVWAWVPFEEDHSQGKDRPVLLVGRDGALLLGLMMTSKDHTRGHDPRYVDVGTGAWDRQGRESEVRLDRVLRLDPSAVRREGAVLGRARFDVVAAALAAR